jgi:hypothetical protein
MLSERVTGHADAMWERLRAKASAAAAARWAALREQRFGVLVTGLAFLAFVAIYAAFAGAHHGEGDGHYTWLYARSIVFDWDLHFRNDYQVCGDFWGVGRDRGGLGRPDNGYYIGPSLFWVPLLWLARKLIPIPANAALSVKMGCAEPLSTFVLAIGPVLGALTLWFSYRVARRHTGDGPAAVATALLGIVGTLPHYAASQPHYSHIYSAFAMGLVALVSYRAWEQPVSVVRWVAVGLAVAVTVLVRVSDAVVVVMPALAATVALRRRWWWLLLAFACIGAGVVLGMIPNLLVFKYLYGKYFVVSQGRYYMNFREAQPWLVLFAPHGGLFYTTPGAWLAVAGAWIGLRRRRAPVGEGVAADGARRWPALAPLTAGMLLVCAVSVYVYGAVHDWGGSYTFGSRRLTGLTTFLVGLAAIAIAQLAAWLHARPRVTYVTLAVVVSALPAIAWLTATTGVRQGHMKLSQGVAQGDFFAASARSFWEMLDDSVGAVQVLPGSLYTWVRYGVPPTSFRRLTEGSWYARNMATLEWYSRSLPVANMAKLGRGLAPDPQGLKLAARRSRLVFSAVWPHATNLVVRMRAAKPTDLRLGRGRLLGTRWYGDKALALKPGENRFDVEVPPGGFARGIGELVFDVADPSAEVVVIEVTYDDRAKYVPPLQP